MVLIFQKIDISQNRYIDSITKDGNFIDLQLDKYIDYPFQLFLNSEIVSFGFIRKMAKNNWHLEIWEFE